MKWYKIAATADNDPAENPELNTTEKAATEEMNKDKTQEQIAAQDKMQKQVNPGNLARSVVQPAVGKIRDPNVREYWKPIVNREVRKPEAINMLSLMDAAAKENIQLNRVLSPQATPQQQQQKVVDKNKPITPGQPAPVKTPAHPLTQYQPTPMQVDQPRTQVETAPIKEKENIEDIKNDRKRLKTKIPQVVRRVKDKGKGERGKDIGNMYQQMMPSLTKDPALDTARFLEETINPDNKFNLNRYLNTPGRDVPPFKQIKQPPKAPPAPGERVMPTNKPQKIQPKKLAPKPPAAAMDKHIIKVAQADQIEQKISGPGEALNLLGADDVVISGDFQPVINVKGVGPINIPITVTDVVNKIKTTLADQHALMKDPSLHDYHHAFQRITNVNIGNFGPGEAGHAESKSPHTININWEGMRQNMEQAVNAQIDSFSQQYGVPPEITEDVIQRIKVKVAETMWNEAAKTVAHESRHARDFQDVLRHMLTTGEGSLGMATEGRAEGEEAEGLRSVGKPPSIAWSRKTRTLWARKK